jgi:hypothetical protein
VTPPEEGTPGEEPDERGPRPSTGLGPLGILGTGGR